jgi:O-antigen ligase
MPKTLLLAVAALLPFERLGSVSLGGVNVRPSQIALALAWLAVTRHALHGRLKLEWRNPAVGWLIVFLGAAALSLFNAENLGRSLLVLAFTVFTASLAVLVPSLLDTPSIFAQLSKIVLVSAAIVGLFGLWQFFGDMIGLPTALTGLKDTYAKDILGFTRIQATAAEPLYFANYLLLPIALAGSWWLAGADRRTSRLLAALLALLLLDLFLTSSRGGYAGLVATLAVLGWSYRSRVASLKRFGLALLLAGMAVALGLRILSGFAVTTREPLSETFVRHVTTLFDGAAFVERAGTFRQGFEAFLAHPWIGVGIGGYGPWVATYPHVRPDAGWSIVNNQPLELLAETGLLGSAAFLGFIIALFRLGTRYRSPSVPDTAREAVRVAALAALAGVLVQYQTFSTLYIMHVWFTVGLLLAASLPRRP